MSSSFRALITVPFLILYGFINSPAYGQLSGLTIKAGANFPIIGNQQQSTATVIPDGTGFNNLTVGSETREEFKSAVGFDFKVLSNCKLSNKFSLNAGLGINYLRFDRDVSVSTTSSTDNLDLGGLLFGDLFGGINTDGLLNLGDQQVLGSSFNFPLEIIYLIIPVHLEYQLTDKLFFSAGLTFMQRLYSKTKTQSFENNFGNIQIIETEDTSGDGLEDTQFMIGISTGYKLNERFDVRLSYDRAVTPIYSDEQQVAGEAKYNLLNLGIAYRVNLLTPLLK